MKIQTIEALVLTSECRLARHVCVDFINILVKIFYCVFNTMKLYTIHKSTRYIYVHNN